MTVSRPLRLAIFLALLAAALLPASALARGRFVRGENIATPITPSQAASRSGSGSEPAPAHSNAASSAGLLFDGSSLNDYGIESAPHAITEVNDPTTSGGPQTAFKMTVHNSDVYPLTPTENPRAQALTPAFIEPGDEFWLATEFMIPQGFPYVSGWMSLIEIYGPPFAGPSPWQISVNEDEFRWMREEGRSIPWHAPLVEGSWQTVLLHERFGTEGFVEMWWNGQRLTFYEPGDINPDHEPPTQRLQLATMDSSNDGGANSAKIMQYRMANMFGTASLYFGPLKIGRTRASVES